MDDRRDIYDFVVVGSGFGGSVSALRLAEKGYRVLVLEKGRRLRADDFPKTNWNLKKWFWLPALRFFGLFKLSFFRHVGVLSGVGVGGGSLVYGNTLPIPPSRFFKAPSWAHLADWETELTPHYEEARRMLGVAKNPRFEVGDRALEELASEIGKAGAVQATEVAVFFGEAGVTVPDPYFNGEGPDRTGCIFCGGCFLGCRHQAKNTLDKNYLYLAEKRGAAIQAESEVIDVAPWGKPDGSHGYRVRAVSSTAWLKRPRDIRAMGIVFAGGVLGTVKLLLKLQMGSLPKLSPRLGSGVRTNSESLIGVTVLDGKTEVSSGIAIGSILHTDDHSFLEPTRYPPGSGFWRLMAMPMVSGKTLLRRLGNLLWDWLRHPIDNLKALCVDDWSKRTQILLFMQTLDSTLRFVRSPWGFFKSKLDSGPAPTAFIPEASDLAERYGKILHGKPMVLLNETLFGIPTTAHILGGAPMGKDAEEGVIDKDQRVFGYANMWICDGSAISANPGVNPSLTITALAERAMAKVPGKSSVIASEAKQSFTQGSHAGGIASLRSQ